jgi:hypothetical protein
MCRLAALALVLAGCVPRLGAEVAAPTLVPPADGDAGALRAHRPVGPQFPVKIGFDWGPPCRVPVTERLVVRDAEATFTYDVVLTHGRESLEVRLERLKIVRIGGNDAAQATLATLAPALAFMPTLLVSEGGKRVGARDIETSLERAMLARGMSPDDPALRSALAFVDTPHGRRMLQDKAAERWYLWAGSWTGAELVPGRQLLGVEQLEIAPGVVVPQPTTVRHLGPVVGAPSLVLLCWRQVMQGPEGARAAVAMRRQLASEAMPPGAIDTIRREAIATVALDSATARPQRARSEVVIDVGKTRVIELRDTTLDWSRAQGCVAR